MTLEIIVALYFTIGVIITTCASIGHKARFGYPLGWAVRWLGIFFWPAIMFTKSISASRASTKRKD